MAWFTSKCDPALILICHHNCCAASQVRCRGKEDSATILENQIHRLASSKGTYAKSNRLLSFLPEDHKLRCFTRDVALKDCSPLSLAIYNLETLGPDKL